MSTLSLKQLKEENEAEETPVEEVNEIDAEADALEEHIESEDEPTDEVTGETDDEPKDDEPAEVEAFMDTGEDEPEKEVVSNDAARSIRISATLKADRKNEAELTRLRDENSQLRAGQTQAPTHGLTMPNRDDYLDQDDPETSYIMALHEYNNKKTQADNTANQQANDLKVQQDASKAAIESNVVKHYDAAAKLLEGSKITQDSYTAADLNVRKMVEGLYPDAGDALVDAFISKMGAGSERVMFNLGINKNRLAQFRESLVGDPTGLDAAIFLGGLNKELNKNSKRRSSAPPPAKHAKGDAKGGSSAERAIKKVYDAAHKKNDSQSAYNAKKKAKASGVDVSNW